MIRPAQPSDVRWLLPQLQRFSVFFGAKHSLFPDYPTAEAIVSDLLASQPFWVAEHTTPDPLGLTDSATAIVGFIGGTIGPHPFNPAITVMQELFWWVDEAHRGTKAGALLLEAFTDYGRAHADWVIMTLEHESPVNERTLTKRGYRPKERSFLLEVA